MIMLRPDVRPVKSLFVSDSPTPWGRRAHRLCRAAAGAGIPGGGIPQAGEAWCPQDPASGPCSPAELLAVPWGRSGTGFLEGIPLILEEEEGEGSWVGFPEQAACWDAGGR